MKTYTIIGGVNGSGKSSLTGALKSQRTDLGCIIDVDKFTVEYNGNYLEAGRAAIEKINDCITQNKSFTQETTLSGSRTLRTIQRARDAGYFIRLFYVGLDTLDESLFRISIRVSRGGHNIPRDDVKRRFEQRFDALLKVLPYCDEVFFFDNYDGFTEIATYRNEELFVNNVKLPVWFKDFQEHLTKNK